MVKTILGINCRRFKWFLPIFESNKYNGGYFFDTPYKRIVNKNKKNKEQDDNCCDKCRRVFCCCCKN